MFTDYNGIIWKYGNYVAALQTYHGWIVSLLG